MSAGQLVSMNMDKIVGGIPHTEFSSTTAAYISSAQIEDSTLFAIAFRDEGDVGMGKMYVGDAATGAQVSNVTVFSQGNVMYVSLATFPASDAHPSRCVVAYQDLCDGKGNSVYLYMYCSAT